MGRRTATFVGRSNEMARRAKKNKNNGRNKNKKNN